MRYIVGDYVTTDRSDAEKRAAQYRKPIREADVELLHRDTSKWDSFCLWSDGKVTSAWGMPADARASSISEAAAHLISLIRESDTPHPACAGGWQTIAAIKRRVQRTTTFRCKDYLAPYVPPQTRVEIYELNDGSLKIFQIDEVGYCEGYEFEIRDVLVPMRGKSDG